jgi:GTP 3',8-cyclase
MLGRARGTERCRSKTLFHCECIVHGLPRTLPSGRPEPLGVSELRIALSARAEYRSSCCACPQAEIPDGVLSTAGILAIVRAFAQLGVKRVRLSGANPNTRPELFALIAAIRGTPGIQEVAVTTSALHLAPVASRYREAGVTRLAVSLCTLDPHRLRRFAERGASLTALIAGVAAAARAGFASLKLDTVVIRDLNDGELGAIVRFAWRHGAVPRLIELMPWGRGEPVPVEEMKVSLRRDGIQLSPDVVRGWGSAECVRGEHDRAEAPRAGPIRLVGPMSRERCAGCNRVRIGVDGTLRRCLSHPVEVRFGDLVRRGAGAGALLAPIREALVAR